MECLITFLVMLVMLTVLSGSVVRLQSGAGRRRRGYQRLAKRYLGSYVSGGLFSRPAVRIRYGETRAVVREAAGRGPYPRMCTQIQIEWPDYRLVCEVLPAAAEAPPAYRNLRDCPTSDQRFDSRFLVRANEQRDALALLGDGVRWQIDRLYGLQDDLQLYLLFRRGTILVQKPRLIRRDEDLEEFVERSLDLYDQVMLTRAEGIEFVDSDQAQTLEQVICKVCGEPIVRDMVYCRRCKTPHHGECWQYAGACSVYGCRETVCLRPQAAAPLGQPQSKSKQVKPR